MKQLIKTFMFAVALFAGCSNGSELPSNSNAVVRFSGLSKSYKVDDKITFLVQTTSEHPQKFTCSVEQLIAGEWREVAASVFASDPMKAVRVVQLKPYASVPIEWDSAHPPSPVGDYRFRIDLYGEVGAAPAVSIHSTSFNLLPK
jgi:hypothetical protein